MIILFLADDTSNEFWLNIKKKQEHKIIISYCELLRYKI